MKYYVLRNETIACTSRDLHPREYLAVFSTWEAANAYVKKLGGSAGKNRHA